MYIQILNFTSNFQDRLQAKNQQQIKSLYQSDPAPLYKTDAKTKAFFPIRKKKTLNVQLQQALRLSH